jgi:3'-phosphoadenosine 5'-phosphosulfate sulfotransferase (PAPS reductase)/FAD synthetase
VVWSDAQEQCRRLATRLGVDLVIVGRKAGGLMDRWAQRWENNVARYCDLSCVKLILPWSTPSMRFCTSELKTKIIQRWIRATYQQPVICALGIRRDEGRSSKSGRGAAPISRVHEVTIKNGKPARPNLPSGSVDWNPIVEVKTERVFQILRASSEPQPSAYLYGASRYSCAFCIMSTAADLFAGTRDPRNLDLYREQCELEIVSTFSFQSGLWLSDIAADLLTTDQRARLPFAKRKAEQRATIEREIPNHLLYTKGWPTVMPTVAEAELIARVRNEVSRIMEFDVRYTTAFQVWGRYDELMKLNDSKRKARKAA